MIKSILERLMEPGTKFRICGGAGDLADVTDQPPALPAVYAYVASEKSEPNERVNALLQRTAVTVSIVIVTGNLSGLNNASAASDLENLKRYVRDQLLGFVPAGTKTPLEHVEGEMQQALGGTVWFEDVFAGAYYQEKRR